MNPARDEKQDRLALVEGGVLIAVTEHPRLGCVLPEVLEMIRKAKRAPRP
jgi:hypothetical protein